MQIHLNDIHTTSVSGKCRMEEYSNNVSNNCIRMKYEFSSFEAQSTLLVGGFLNLEEIPFTISLMHELFMLISVLEQIQSTT